MASVPLVASPAPDLENAIPAPPPGSCTLCGRCYCGPIDYCLSGTHIVLGSSFIAALVTGSSYLAIGIGVGELGLCTAHFAYQRWGNIARIIDVFKNTAAGYKTALSNQQKIADQWKGQVEALQKENGALLTANQEFKTSLGSLQGVVENSKKAVEEFGMNNETLKKINADLGARVSQAEEMAQKYRASIGEFAKSNAAFNQELQKISVEIPALKTEAGAVEATDHEFGEILQQMTRSQLLSKQIIAAFQKQNQDLAQKIASFETDETHLEVDEKRVSDADLLTQADVERLRQENETLKHRIDELEQSRVAQHLETEKLRAAIENLHKEREAISHDLSPLAHLKSSFGADLAALRASNAALAAQIKESEK